MTAGWTPDGTKIYSSCWDQKVRVWDATKGTLLFELIDDASNQSWTAQASPNSELIAAGNGDGHVRVWSLADGSLQYKLPLSEEQNDVKKGGWFRAMAWNPDSRHLRIGNDKGVRMYELSGGNLAPQRQQAWLFAPYNRDDWSTRPYEVQNVTLSANGSRIAIPLGNGHRTIYHCSSNVQWEIEETQDLKNRVPNYGKVAFLNDEGSQIASFDTDGIIRIWSLAE